MKDKKEKEKKKTYITENKKILLELIKQKDIKDDRGDTNKHS